VGNQSDKALQILVATPVFCYWIFGSMNLISGYLVHCRTKEILRNSNTLSLQQQLQQLSAHSSSGIGVFLFIYGLACALLLLAVIYEFANIDVWLGSGDTDTPLWPFLVRAFMELMLGICCFAWVLGPSISTLYKRQVGNGKMVKQPTAGGGGAGHMDGNSSSRGSHVACNSTVVSYHSVRPSMASAPLPQSPYKLKTSPGAGSISLNQMSNYSLGRSMHHQQRHSPHHHHQQQQQLQQHHHHHHSSSSLVPQHGHPGLGSAICGGENWHCLWHGSAGPQ